MIATIGTSHGGSFARGGMAGEVGCCAAGGTCSQGVPYGGPCGWNGPGCGFGGGYAEERSAGSAGSLTPLS